METDDTKAVPAEPESDEDLTGAVLSDRYRLVERIGEGGMGTIYRAEHIHMRKTLAVKVLHPALTTVEEVVLRFEREAQAAANIEHPNVCAATDFGRAESGAFYLVMEYLKGRTLGALLAQDGNLALERALKICRQVCLALGRAHELGIVHRDLKPENILLVERDDDEDHVKVLDFGIARVELPECEEGEKVKTLTKAGMVMGTPAYLSPEQAAGAATDHRTDLYSLGVCLFEMIAGRRPFDSPSAIELMRMHVVRPPPRLRSMTLTAPIPGRLDRLVDRLLAKEPHERPANAGEILRELDLIEEEMRTREGSLRSRAARTGVELGGAIREAAPLLLRVPALAKAVVVLHVLLVLVGVPAALWAILGGSEPGSSEAAGVAASQLISPGLNGASTAAPPSRLDQARARPAIAKALSIWQTHGPVVASRKLGDLYEHAPTPELAYLLATAEAEADEEYEALRHAKSALEGNPELAKEPELRPFVLEQLQGRHNWLAFKLVQEHYLPYVVPELEKMACAPDRPPGSRAAQKLLAEGAALDRVALWCKLSIELDTAGSCRDRLAIIQKIRALGDARALPALRRVDVGRRGRFRRRRRNACLHEELRAALNELGGESPDADPAENTEE